MVKKIDKPEKEEPKAEGTAAANAESKKTSETKSKDAVITPLPVEIKFQGISNLKMVPNIDENGNLLLSVAFTSVTNQYEIFRLVNLLKQAHGSLYAIVGTNQSAMDFKFDVEGGKVEILKAEKALPPGSSKTVEKKDNKTTADQATVETTVKGSVDTERDLKDVPPAVKIQTVSFNHIPEEPKPYGVAVDYADTQGEIHTGAGRGKNPTEAVIEFAERAGIVPATPGQLAQPFEVSAALEKLEPSPETNKLIRVIQVGSFEEGGDTEGSK